MHPRTRSPHFLIHSVPLSQKQAFYAKHDPSKTQDEIRELVRKYKKGNTSPPPRPPIFSLHLHPRAPQPCVAPGCISMQKHKQANSWSCVADSAASTASILHLSRLPSLSSDALLFVPCCCTGLHTLPSLFRLHRLNKKAGPLCASAMLPCRHGALRLEGLLVQQCLHTERPSRLLQQLTLMKTTRHDHSRTHQAFHQQHCSAAGGRGSILRDGKQSFLACPPGRLPTCRRGLAAHRAKSARRSASLEASTCQNHSDRVRQALACASAG